MSPLHHGALRRSPVFLVGAALIIGVVGALSAGAASAAPLQVSPTSLSDVVGGIVTATIQINTQGAAIAGADVSQLRFNPALLEVVDDNVTLAGTQITPGTLLSSTPANSADNILGTVTFSQVTNGGATYTNTAPATLATVRFRAKAAGTATVTFDFTPGNTTDSNVAAAGADVLASVTNGTVTVNPAVDSTPPAVSMTAPADGATLSGSVAVSANASDNVGVVGVQFLLDGTNLQSEDTTAPYSILWDTTSTSNTTHTLSARARDAAGNTVLSTPRTVTVNYTAQQTKFTLGDRVKVTTKKLNVRATPGGKNLGFHKLSDQGSVLAGPTTANGYSWYNINYDTAPDGWSAENYLEKVTTTEATVSTLLADLSSSTTHLSQLATPLTAESQTLILSEIGRLISVIGRLLQEMWR